MVRQIVSNRSNKGVSTWYFSGFSVMISKNYLPNIIQSIIELVQPKMNGVEPLRE